MKWCGQVVTLKENVLSIPNGRWPHDTPDSRRTLLPLRYGRPLSASRGMGGTRNLWVSLVWNDVVKISRLKETFWAFQMGDDPMTFKIPDGNSPYWAMGGHSLEGLGWDWATQRESQARNGVVKILHLKKTFWAFPMGNDPMTFKIPDGNSPYWAMGHHCLER